jgi:rhomboid protease GluP
MTEQAEVDPILTASRNTPMADPPATPDAPVAPPVRTLALPSVNPIFTYAFLVANVLVFGATLSLGRTPRGIPLLFELGWKDSAAIVAGGEYWRLVTPIFLHANLLHLGFNCYALYILGPQVERHFGYMRFLVVYLLSGIAGVIASVAFKPAAYSVGASGAIFGLVGALIVYLYQNRDLFGGMGRRRLASAIQVAVMNLIIGFASGGVIDNWGHIGGFAGGAAITWLLGPLFAVEGGFDVRARVEDRRPVAVRWAAAFASVAALVALTGLVIVLRS